MPTVAETLKASGMTDEAIAALDQSVVASFQNVLTVAEQAQASAAQMKEQAELAERTQRQVYDEKVAPALDAWGNEKIMKDSEIAFYRAQNEAARANGFIAKDAPTFSSTAPTPNPNAPGFVANANVVPGSPAFMTKQEGVRAVANATWAISEHMRLHGAPPPDDIETLAQEAENKRLPFRDHVAQKYNFEGRRKEIVEKRQQEEKDKLVAETIKERDKFWAERGANNPNVRTGGPSEFTNLKKGVDAKQLKDPLSMNKQQRHEYTQSMIHKDIVENTGAVN